MPERDLSLSMAVWSHEHLTNATLLLLLRIRSIALLSRQRLDTSCYCRSLGNEPCRLWMNSFWTKQPAMHEDCLSSTDTDKKKDVVIVVVHHRRHHQCCRPRRRRCDRSSLGDCLSKLKLPDWWRKLYWGALPRGESWRPLGVLSELSRSGPSLFGRT